MISRAVVKAACVLLPLLGITWVFGIFAVNEETVVFAWLFTIFNSLQVQSTCCTLCLCLVVLGNVYIPFLCGEK